MPSLRIAMRSVQVFSVGMLYQQSPHDRMSVPSTSDTVPIDPIVTSNVSIDSSSVFENEVLSTSTPTKAISIPADSHQYKETISHSESILSAIPSSVASTESSDTEDANYFAMNTMVIEQLQFHPSRVWNRK